MVWNYDGKRFGVVANTSSGEVSGDTLFVYHQRGSVLWGTYEGGAIVMGSLVGLVQEGGNLEFRYAHVNSAGLICGGVCKSAPTLLPDGRIRLHEQWRWTTGDLSEGESVLEECPS